MHRERSEVKLHIKPGKFVIGASVESPAVFFHEDAHHAKPGTYLGAGKHKSKPVLAIQFESVSSIETLETVLALLKLMYFKGSNPRPMKKKGAK